MLLERRTHIGWGGQVFGMLSISDFAQVMAVCENWRKIASGSGSGGGSSMWVERLWKAAFARRWSTTLAHTAGITRLMGVPSWRQRCLIRGHIDRNWRTGHFRRELRLSDMLPPLQFLNRNIAYSLCGDHVVIGSLALNKHVVQLWPTRQQINPTPFSTGSCTLLGPASLVGIDDDSTVRSKLSVWCVADSMMMRSIGHPNLHDIVRDHSPMVWTTTGRGCVQFDVERGVHVSQLGQALQYQLAIEGHSLVCSDDVDNIDIWDTRTSHKMERFRLALQGPAISVDGHFAMFVETNEAYPCAELWDLRRTKERLHCFSDTHWAAVAGGRTAILSDTTNRLQIFDSDLTVPRVNILAAGQEEFLMDSERIVGCKLGILDFACL